MGDLIPEPNPRPRYGTPNLPHCEVIAEEEEKERNEEERVEEAEQVILPSLGKEAQLSQCIRSDVKPTTRLLEELSFAGAVVAYDNRAKEAR